MHTSDDNDVHESAQEIYDSMILSKDNLQVTRYISYSSEWLNKLFKQEQKIEQQAELKFKLEELEAAIQKAQQEIQQLKEMN